MTKHQIRKPIKTGAQKADHGPNGPNGPRCQVTHESNLIPLTPLFSRACVYLAFQAVRAVRAVFGLQHTDFAQIPQTPVKINSGDMGSSPTGSTLNFEEDEIGVWGTEPACNCSGDQGPYQNCPC